MLKGKVQGLEKRISKIKKQKATGVYFAGIVNGEYVVKSTPGMNTTFQGDKESFEKYQKQHGPDSVFIIDDIPREENETNIFDWID